MHYCISPRAFSDLDAIWSYIAADNPRAADRTIDSLHVRFALLASQPLIGQDRADLRPGVRMLSAGSYSIYFTSAPGGVEIVRVLHAAREEGGALN